MKNAYYVFFLLLIFVNSCKRNTVTLVSNNNNLSKYVFDYSPEGITETKMTYYGGKKYANTTFYPKKTDGYYQDVSSVTNEQDYKKFLILNNTRYSYDNPFIGSRDITNYVEIKEIETNKYRYKKSRGFYFIEIYYDQNYKIYRVVEKKDNDSVIYVSK